MANNCHEDKINMQGLHILKALFSFLQTVQLLLEHHANPYQENDHGVSPISACKNPQILHLLREGSRVAAREESDEEEVFVSKEKQKRIRATHIKKGSKGSSRSSGESFYEEEDELVKDKGKDKLRGSSFSDGVSTPDGTGSRTYDQTPKSRPRSVLYSDLSSSESEGEHIDASSSSRAKSGVHKVRYHLAKMGEAKQKLLGKLEESGELDCGLGSERGTADVGGSGGRGREGDNTEDNCTGIE